MNSAKMGKTRDLFKIIRDTKGTFHEKMGMIKDRSSKDIKEADEIKKRCERQSRKGKVYPTECRGPETSKER